MEWSIMANLTHYRNEITAMPYRIDLVKQQYTVWKKGASVYDFYLPESAGVNPDNGEELYYYYEDNGQKSKTSIYTLAAEKGRKDLGSALPKLFGSVGNDLTYKNFTLSLLFTFGLGGKYYDNIYEELMTSQNMGQNFSEDLLGRWTPENRNSAIPRLEYGNLDIAQPSSRFLSDASYLSWRNASLAYTFRPERIQKLKLKSLKIYAAGDNLMLFSARKGMDPQATFNGNPGYVYSPARTIIVGLKVGL